MRLPSIEKRFRNPGLFKLQLVAYLEWAGANVDQEKRVASISFFDSNAQGAAAGTVRFFNGSTFVATNTNLDGFQRPQSEHVVITNIRIAEGVDAVISSTDWIFGTQDPAIKNGLMTITTNGGTQLRNYPMLDAIEGLTTDSIGEISLFEPIIWIGQTPLQIEQVFLIAAAANTNIRVELVGVGLIA